MGSFCAGSGAGDLDGKGEIKIGGEREGRWEVWSLMLHAGDFAGR